MILVVLHLKGLMEWFLCIQLSIIIVLMLFDFMLSFLKMYHQVLFYYYNNNYYY